jgi:hypothetical protein
MDLQLKKSLLLLLVLLGFVGFGLGLVSADNNGSGEQPLSKIAIHKATRALNDDSSITAYPSLLGLKVTNFIHYMLSGIGIWFCFATFIIFLWTAYLAHS